MENLVELEKNELQELNGGILIGLAIRVYLSIVESSGGSMSEVATEEEWETGTTGVTSSPLPF